MKCSYCNEEAIVKKHGYKYCKEHFLIYYKNRVKKILDKLNLKNKKILIACSGGKDSQSLIDILAKLKDEYGYYIEALFIKLGIGEDCKTEENSGFNKFCKSAYINVKKICDKYNIKLNIYDTEKNYGISIPKISKIYKKTCSACGTIKRYIMNKFAFENNFDYIATGHNLTDIVIFVHLNIISNNYNNIEKNIKFYVEGDKNLKLVGKIKPLFYLEDEDNIIYCKINNIEYISSSDSCPYRDKDSSHVILQDILNNLGKKYNYFYHFINFLTKKSNYNLEIKPCKLCGYPTSSNDSICKFCKIYTLNSKNETKS